MSIIIRTATMADLKAIQKLGFELLDFERQNWDPTLDVDWPFSEVGKASYEKAIKEKYTIIAEADGKPIGYLIGSVKPSMKDGARHITAAQLENIYVDQNYRRSNVGKKLFESFATYCKKQKADVMNVMVNAKNKNAISFYEKVGFSPSRISFSQEL
ncbi:GNAT family N-acetyltransferase [Candidatus Saccharibacteria bacterium]|nr:GNAT family N-acetyltransferase [Candidatus Saccharibacteria bacterium]